MKISTATTSDLGKLLRLYAHLNDDDAPSSHDDARKTFEQISNAPGLSLLIGEIEEEAVTSCYLNIIPNLTRGCRSYALIENVVTHRNYRRRGFGKQIIDAALSAAWEAGCYKVMLLTGSSKAVPFYVACGFKADEKHGLLARSPF